MEKLIKVQSKLKSPKNQVNKFGGYKYRSCEDIFESVKPLLAEEGLLLTVSDEMVAVTDRVYVKATATVTDPKEKTYLSVSAFARESATRKGMDDSQITGSASSYARKYALNGLFLIDDTKDADTQNHSEEEVKFLSESEKSLLLDMLVDAEVDQKKFFKHFGCTGIEDFPLKKLAQAKIAIETKKKKEGK